MNFQSFNQFSLSSAQEMSITGGAKRALPQLTLPPTSSTNAYSAATNAPALVFPVIEQPPLPPILIIDPIEYPLPPLVEGQ